MKHKISTLQQGDLIFIGSFLGEVISEHSGEYALAFDNNLNVAALRLIQSYFHAKENQTIYLKSAPYLIKHNLFFKARRPSSVDTLIVFAEAVPL